MFVFDQNTLKVIESSPASLPTVGVATEIYQLFLELARAHPKNNDLVGARDSAWSLLKLVWDLAYADGFSD